MVSTPRSAKWAEAGVGSEYTSREAACGGRQQAQRAAGNWSGVGSRTRSNHSKHAENGRKDRRWRK